MFRLSIAIILCFVLSSCKIGAIQTERPILVSSDFLNVEERFDRICVGGDGSSLTDDCFRIIKLDNSGIFSLSHESGPKNISFEDVEFLLFEFEEKFHVPQQLAALGSSAKSYVVRIQNSQISTATIYLPVMMNADGMFIISEFRLKENITAAQRCWYEEKNNGGGYRCDSDTLVRSFSTFFEVEDDYLEYGKMLR